MTLGCLVAILGALGPVAVRAGDADEPRGETSAGWVKYAKNPVLGGDLGTYFDISVLRESGPYRM